MKKKAYLSGFINKDDGLAMVGNVVFADYMYKLAEEIGIAYQYNDNLGGERAFIPKCNISMYTSKEKISLEEAKENFLEYMFNGDFNLDKENIGYSEWTITGYDLNKCHLGGHDINSILLSHKGEYVNITIECDGKIER